MRCYWLHTYSGVGVCLKYDVFEPQCNENPEECEGFEPAGDDVDIDFLTYDPEIAQEQNKERRRYKLRKAKVKNKGSTG